LSDDADQPQPEGSDERTNVQPSDAEKAILDLKPPKHRKEDRVKREQREADEFWRACLSTPIGRRECWRLIAAEDAAHAFQTHFRAGPSGVPDKYATWYAKGEQDFGLRLYQRWLMLDVALVALMHKENDHRFAKPEGA